ncbi:ECF RNA polymerase sigma factor SigE [Rubripirellula obstinata]|uniref:ECF RNA polymerase sigma factor SigE n=1 Tax=Rubripirellula obstinata TaxID=406547 RepID=A0A5B1CKI1_9BACT|nr:sigma-70 family RNA polymerase sigma factor [Rubripirellula obstinata]KAA1260239.1 ECF RNA polymerase sigma factor SigE [Rubripirellula obstinata]
MTNVQDDNLRPSRDAAGAPLSSEPDSQLLRLMQSGDAEAWRTLYHRYLPSVWRYAWQLVGDQQVAEDLVAESLLAMCRKAHEFDPQTFQLHGWLRGVIRHKAMDHYRSKGRLSAALDQRAMLQQSIETQRQSDNFPSARLEQAERINIVLSVLEDLDAAKSQCLEWKYIDQLPVREIAARLDSTEKAVESLLYRARQEFRERFEQREHDGDESTKHASSAKPFNNGAAP